MLNNIIKTISAFCMFSSLTLATIINIPDDYSRIQLGVNASTDGDTILVQPGAYSYFYHVSSKNIVLASLYLTTEDSSYISSTILDGNDTNYFAFFDQDSTAMLIGFTIQNSDGPGVDLCSSDMQVCYNIIQNNYAISGAGISCYDSDASIHHNIIQGNTTPDPISYLTSGAGIDLYNSDAKIVSNIITDNSAGMWGGAIDCSNSNAIISNNIISNNEARSSISKAGGIYITNCDSLILQNNIIYGNTAASGGGIFSSESTPVISNNTIIGNSSTNGGGFMGEYSDAILINNIFWDNDAQYGDEISYSGGLPVITYCDIQEGWTGEGNIDSDPLFIDPDNGDYNLMAGSPCIDAGDPDSPYDPDSTRADIGAFYYDQTVAVGDIVSLPMKFSLTQNYPNPFNASTIISYTLPEPAHISLTIYDILGRQVIVPINEMQNAGEHSITWSADNYPSGVYFARLKYLDRSESIKMLMVK